MKKILVSVLAIAAAAFAFDSCQKAEKSIDGNVQTVEFYARSIESRTAFGDKSGSKYPTLWTANDSQIKIALNDNAPKDGSVDEVAVDGTTAKFSAAISSDDSGAYVFYALSPASAFQGSYASEGKWGINIPTAQTPLAGSPDEAAQIIAAKTDAGSTFPSSVDFDFTHVTAYAKISCINVDLGTAVVSSVSITADENIAGRWYYTEGSGVSEWSASATIAATTSSLSDIWFALAPVDLSGKKIKVVINTDKGTFTKSVTIPSSHPFKAGYVASFNVDFDEVAIVSPKNYDLVKNISSLTAGAEVIIAAVASDVAISTTQNGNNRGVAAISRSGERISDPADAVEIFTVSVSAGTYAFQGKNDKYIVWVDGKNYLRSQDDPAYWTVSVTGEGVASISGGSPTRYIKHNSGSSIFGTYTSGQNDIAIYAREDSREDSGLAWSKAAGTATITGSTPTTDYASLTNPNGVAVSYASSDEDVATIASDGTITLVAEGSTEISASFAGDATYKPASVKWTLTVTDSREVCAPPTFSPVAGAVAANTVVTISSATTGSTIYYTTDNSDPTTASAHGTVGAASVDVTIDAAKTIKAIAVKDPSNKPSAVASAKYTIAGAPTPPSPETITFSEQGYSNAEVVTSTSGTNFDVSFTNGSTNTAYYNTGLGVRIYGGGSVTVTAKDPWKISGITYTFASGYAPSGTSYTVSPGSLTAGASSTWTGSATSSVTLSRPSGSGHWRLQSITVTFSN